MPGSNATALASTTATAILTPMKDTASQSTSWWFTMSDQLEKIFLVQEYNEREVIPANERQS